MRPCPSDRELLAFHLGKLPESEVDAVAEHLEACPRCDAVVQQFDATDDPLLAALRHAPSKKSFFDRQTLLRPEGALEPDEPEVRPELPGYEVLDCLGKGGMGTVYRAVQRSLQRIVAVKQLRVDNARHLSRSRAEAEVLARLHHPNIVEIHEIVTHEGRTYLALEMIDGGSLGAKISGKPQAPRETAALIETIARAVHHAHLHGIIHRDLKPSNILLSGRTSDVPTLEETPSFSSFCTLHGKFCIPKVADFGIAKHLDADSGATREGDVLGTPCYMAPEQAAGQIDRIGPATDVYSLGVILYEMLTGRVPLQGPTTLDTLMLVRHEEPVPPRRLQPRIPRDLETICLKCLQKQPTQRYGSAAELADDLRRFLDHRTIRAKPATLGERAWKLAKRRPREAALSAALLLLAIVALVLVIGQWRRAEGEAVQARRAEQDAERRRKRAQETEAHLALQQGLALCERGDIGRGLLWLSRGLERADSAGASSLDRSFRVSLAAWSSQIRPPGQRLHNPAAVLAMDFDPKGQLLLAGGKDGQVHFWDVRSGREMEPALKPPTSLPKIWVGCVEFSPDGRRIATSSNDEAVLWDAATHRILGEPLPHPPGMIWGMAFLPDGKRLATSSDDASLRIWDTETRRVLVGPVIHSEVKGYYTLAVAPDGGSLITTGQDGRGMRWTVDRGARTVTALSHDSPVLKAVFSRDGGKLFTATRGGTLHAWNLTNGRLTDLPPQGTEVTALALSPDGRLLASGTGFGITRLWDTSTLRPLGAIYRDRARISALVFNRSGDRLAIGMEDGEIRIVEPPPPLEAAPPAFLGREIRTLQYSRDGRRLLAGTQDGAHWIEAATGRRVGAPLFNPEDFGVEGAALSPDDKTIAMGRWSGKPSYWRGRTEVWDAAARKRLWQSADQKCPVAGVIYNRDSQLLFSWGRTDDEGESIVWDVASGRRRQTMKTIGRVHICKAVFHPDGRALLLACDDGLARLWDIAAGAEIAADRPMQHAAAVTACAFDAAGRRILTGCRDGTAQLWDMETHRPLLEPMRHDAEVSAVTFSPDGRTLLTGSLDGTARFWDAGSGKQLGPTLWHADGVRALAFHPDGRRVAVGGKDFAVRQWHIPALPLPGDPEKIRWGVEALTGLELDERGAVHALSSEERAERRRRLREAGAAMPSQLTDNGD